MVDQSTQSIVIDAPPAEIMAVIADFPAYPKWAASVKSCEVLQAGADGRAKQVHFVVDAGVLRDDYVLEYDWVCDTVLSWQLTRGDMLKAMDGTYTLTDNDVWRQSDTARITAATA